jgi:nicotinamide-nucleotide amidase
MLENNLDHLAEEVGKLLAQKKYRLVTAESCTGGWISQAITAIPGVSEWFDCGLVTYSNEAKQRLLNVAPQLLDQYGAVSEQTAVAMVEGALANSKAQVAVSVTGIAGPTGATDHKPVGTVWFAWLEEGGPVKTELCQFTGARNEIRYQSVEKGLKGLIELLK